MSRNRKREGRLARFARRYRKAVGKRYLQGEGDWLATHAIRAAARLVGPLDFRDVDAVMSGWMWWELTGHEL